MAANVISNARKVWCNSIFLYAWRFSGFANNTKKYLRIIKNTKSNVFDKVATNERCYKCRRVCVGGYGKGVAGYGRQQTKVSEVLIHPAGCCDVMCYKAYTVKRS
jgi:hypothetical protein